MVEIELAADAQFARDLAAGGVFVPGCALRLAEECDLVVRGADHELVLPARVVYVDEHRGAGLELVGFSTETREQLTQLSPLVRPSMELIEEPVVEETAHDDISLNRPSLASFEAEPRSPTEPVPLVVLAAFEDDAAPPVADSDSADTAAFRQAGAAGRPDEPDEPDEAIEVVLDGDDLAIAIDMSADTAAYPQVRGGGRFDWRDEETTMADRGAVADQAAADADRLADTLAAGDAHGAGHADERAANHGDDDEITETDPEAETPRSGRTTGKHSQPLPRNVQERLRGLTLVAQLKLAVSGELHERIVLERLYGKNVWETLLRNPRLTPPEVSRIARYGSLPRVLLELIVGNNAWLQVPEVRRALLTNPRLGLDQIMKVLRLTPKHELKLAAIQTAYPIAVRNAAKMMIVRGE